MTPQNDVDNLDVLHLYGAVVDKRHARLEPDRNSGRFELGRTI